MTSDLIDAAGPLLAQMQERLGNGYVVLMAQVSSIADKSIPMVDWKAYHFATGFSSDKNTPEEAVSELLNRSSATDLMSQAERLRDRAEELERAAKEFQNNQ